MIKIKFCLYILVIYCFISCASKEEDVDGLYVSKNNINTIDSVWVYTNGNYKNLMYRKIDNSLVYKNTGKWIVDNGYITFFNFFTDEDELHSQEFTNFENILITTKFQLEHRLGKIIIRHKDMYDNIYLEKVE